MSAGKALRLRRIIHPESQTTMMFAFSHGTSAPTVLPGIEDTVSRLQAAREGGADCIFLAPGLIERLAPVIAESRDFGIVAKITATATRGGTPHQERLIASVESCVELGRRRHRGAAAVRPGERTRRDLADRQPRRGVPSARRTVHRRGRVSQCLLRRAGLRHHLGRCRICAGALACARSWAPTSSRATGPGAPRSSREIVDSVSVPVVVAGGSRESDLDLLRKIEAARSVGRDRLFGGSQHLPARQPGRDHASALGRGEGRADPGAGGRRTPRRTRRSRQPEPSATRSRRCTTMKAVVLNAEWAPREGVSVDPANAARRWAVNANLVYRNPSASFETVDDPGEPGPRELSSRSGPAVSAAPTFTCSRPTTTATCCCPIT